MGGRFFLFILGGLGTGGLALALLLPREPELLSSYAGEQAKSGYYPGGPDCRPPAQSSRSEDASRTAERVRCEDAYEEHRLKQQELIQQTRAADAAASSQRLAVSQSISLAASTALGLVTLLAAAAAAYFAKRAAEETRRNAEAAGETLRHLERVSDEELRPYVFFGECNLEAPYGPTSDLLLKVHNRGKTPAENIRVGMRSEVRKLPIGHQPIPREDLNWSQVPTLGPGAEDCGRISLAELNDQDTKAIVSGSAAFVCLVRLEYEGRKELNALQEIEIYVDKDSLRHGVAHTLTDSARSKGAKSEQS